MNHYTGRQIGPYRIIALLGEGGMGAVYRAYDPATRQPVALKIVYPHLAGQRQFQQRFLREVEAAARLDHPNIVQILDSATSDSLLYLVMEYVPGGTLGSYMRRLEQKNQQSKLRETLLLTAQVAEALAYAHRQGVVHGDIKPDNILLKPVDRPDRPGEPAIRALVTDFGLATLLEGTEDTGANLFAGSLPYMSPEQCMARPLDGRSDIYSLGVVLYRLTTGRLPFDIKLPTDAVIKHTSETPPAPRILRPDLPDTAETVILTALAKNPEDRFSTADAMAHALRQALPAQPMPTAVPAPLISPRLKSRPADIPQQPTPQSMPTPRAQPTPQSMPTPMDELTPPPPIVADPNVTQLQATDWAAVPGQMEVDQSWPEGEDRLIIGQRGAAPLHRPMDKDILTIGRDEDNDIVLPAISVSRRHARLEQTPTGWLVVDLDSTNGTYLEGSRLLPDVPETWEPAHQTLAIGPFFLQWRAAKQRASRNALLGSQVHVVSTTNGEAAPDIHSSPQLSLLVNPPQVSVIPGNQVEQEIALFNQGVTVNHYQVRVEGIPAVWVTAPAAAVQLLPGERGSLRIVIHPPHESASTAGEHPYRLIITSTLTEQEMMVIPSSVTIAPFGGFSTDMQPKSLQGRGTCRVLINNEGNFDATYSVIGRDPGEAVRFIDPRKPPARGEDGRRLPLSPQAQKRSLQLLGRLPFLRQYRGLSSQVTQVTGALQPAEPVSGPQPRPNQLGIVHTRVKIAAGAQGTVDLEVEPRQRPFLGRTHTLPFEVQISEPTVEPQSLTGQLEVSPIVPPWLPPVLAALLILLCLSGAAIAAYVNQQREQAVATVVADVTATAVAFGEEDSDGDGLTNAQEAILGSNPNNPDSNGDGTPDGTKVAEGVNPAAPPESTPAIVVGDLPTTTAGIANGQPVFTNTNTLNVVFGPCGLDAGQMATIIATTPGDYQVIGGPCPYLVPIPPTPLPTSTPSPTLTPSATPTASPTPTPSLTPVVNTAPLAAPDNFTTAEDTPLNSAPASVLSNDTDPDSALLTAVLDRGPTNGSLTLNTDGIFLYTPTANFSGADSFTYRASDGLSLSNIVTVLINVTPVNDPPVAVPDRYSVDEDNILNSASLSVLDNDFDVDSPLITAVLVNATVNGALTFNTNGTFVYTPNANFFGSDTFTYQASDGVAASAVTTVIITVGGVNDAPVAVNDTYTINEDTPFNSAPRSVLENDFDVDNAPLTAVLDTPPDSGEIEFNSDGSFTYTPALNATNPVNFIYHAFDGQANSNAASVTIHIIAVNDPPVIDLNGPNQEGNDFAAVFTNSGPILITGDEMSVTDVDNTTLVSATVRLVGGPHPSLCCEELAASVDGSNITPTYDANTGVLHLTGADSVANYQQVLRTVTYEDTDAPSDPEPFDRNIEFVVSDGTAVSNIAITVVSICYDFYCTTISPLTTTGLLYTAGFLNAALVFGLVLVTDWPKWLKRLRKER